MEEEPSGLLLSLIPTSEEVEEVDPEATEPFPNSAYSSPKSIKTLNLSSPPTHVNARDAHFAELPDAISTWRAILTIISPFALGLLAAGFYCLFPISAYSTCTYAGRHECLAQGRPADCCVNFWLYLVQTSGFEAVGSFVISKSYTEALPIPLFLSLFVSFLSVVANVVLITWYKSQDSLSGHATLRTLAPYPVLAITTVGYCLYTVLVLRPRYNLFKSRQRQAPARPSLQLHQEPSLNDTLFVSTQPDAHSAHAFTQDGFDTAQRENQSSASGVRLHAHPLLQFLLSALFSYLMIVAFQLLQMVSAMSQSTSTSEFKEAKIFIIFVAVTLIMKLVLRSVGYLLDLGKAGSGASQYFGAEILLIISYYFFYRNLFTKIESIWQFAALQVLHVSVEWLVYPFRTSRFYFRCFTRQRSVPRLLRVMPKALTKLYGDIIQADLSTAEWNQFVLMDYGVRLLCIAVSAIYYVGFFTIVRFGWNRAVFSYYAQISKKQYTLLVYFTLASLVVEFANAYAIHLFFKRRNLFVLRRLYCMFCQPSMFWLTVVIVGPMGTNPYLAVGSLVWGQLTW